MTAPHFSSRDWRNDDGVWNWHRLQAEWGQAEARPKRKSTRPERPAESSLVAAITARADRAAAKAEREAVQVGATTAANRATAAALEDAKLDRLIEQAVAEPVVRFESLLSRLRREPPALLEEPQPRESGLPEPSLGFEHDDGTDLDTDFTF
jgi:hypothetical protein